MINPEKSCYHANNKEAREHLNYLMRKKAEKEARKKLVRKCVFYAVLILFIFALIVAGI